MHLDIKASIRKTKTSDWANTDIHYTVRPLNLNYQVFWNSANRVKEIPYVGPVYCVTVPNSTLFVRDKDEKTAVACGNCQDIPREIIPIANESMSRSLYK
jgi:hypothetical protein